MLGVSGLGAQRISSFTYIKDRPDYNEDGSEQPDNGTFKNSTDILLNVRRKSLSSQNEERYIQGAKRVLGFMYEAWLNNKLCDVVIKVDSGEIHAHKMVLCAYSNAMVKECECFPKGNIVLLDLSDFSQDTVLELLYFVYTTSIRIHDGNVRATVKLATELEVTVLLELCGEYLNNFNIQNALKNFEIAEETGLDIALDILKFICENFIDIVNNSEFLQLSLDRLLRILSDEKIYINSDLDIFLAIVRWINHDQGNRLPQAPTLLLYVRFYRITPDTLVSKVEIFTDIFEMRECHNMLYEAMKYHALTLSGSSLVSQFVHFPKPNKSQERQAVAIAQVTVNQVDTTKKVIMTPPPSPVTQSKTHVKTSATDSHYMPGTPQQSGQLRNLINTVKVDIQPPTSNSEYYARVQEAAQSQHQQSSLPAIYHTGATESIESMNREHTLFPSLVVVCVGGTDTKSFDDTYPGRCVYKYDDKVNEWSLLTMMGAYTHHHTSAAVSGKLYVIGGILQNNNQPDAVTNATSAVRMYDCETSTWVQASPMLQARAYITAAVYKHAIYVAGGEDENRIKLDTIEKYDTTFDKWIFVARMRGGPKIGAAICVFKNCLYVVGGYCPDRPDGPVLTDVECFDLIRQKWVDRAPLNVSRCHANLVVADGKMYLVGGKTQSRGSGSLIHQGDLLTSMSSIAMYDDVSDVWFHVTDMMTPRLDCGCTSIGSKIFIIGGIHTPNPTCLDLVECFDTATRTWQQNLASLPQPAVGLSCVTL